jgi:hypothetical protein
MMRDTLRGFLLAATCLLAPDAVDDPARLVHQDDAIERHVDTGGMSGQRQRSQSASGNLIP